jgi:hypothetical protein
VPLSRTTPARPGAQVVHAATEVLPVAAAAVLMPGGQLVQADAPAEDE